MASEPPSVAPLAPRIALLSIACFWTFYFTIWSLRATVLYHSDEAAMLGIRAIVSLFSAGLTILFYLLMRRVSAARLGCSFGLALVLAVPAAIVYSTFNWYMFNHFDNGRPMKSWSAPSTRVSPAAPPASARSGVRSQAPVSVGMMHMKSGEELTPFQSVADQAGNGYFFFIAWAALYLALSYAAEIGALERRAAILRAAAQSAELKALRYQVNPHFLFNTLNSLSSLVLAGKRDQAERMIINLATFFRTSLTGDPTEDVPLSEEIMLQRLYLDIEQVRFPERLLAQIEIPESMLGVCVPGLILQPLVENAVKYGVSRSLRPVTIRIEAWKIAEGIVLSVKDDGDQTAPAIEGGTGVGLRNVRDRLAARFGDIASCRWGPGLDGGFAVELTLPSVQHGC